MLTRATESLMATARDAASTDAEINAAAQSFFDAIRSASRDDAHAALRALSGHFSLPDDSSAFWIWNEGTPADIPVFDGRRVILLGPASYPRSWQSQRMFDNLPAKLEIEHKLTKDEIQDWLQRMLTAKSAS